MKRNTPIIIIITLCVLYSCNSNKIEVIKTGSEISLKGTNISSGTLLVYPDEFINYNDSLLLSDLSGDFYFRKISTKKISIDKSFGKRGEGPEEVLNPPMLLNQIKEPFFFFYDFSKKEVYKTKEKDSSVIKTDTYPLPEIMYSKQSLYMLNDSIVIGGGGEKTKISTHNIFTKKSVHLKLDKLDQKLIFKKNNYQLKTFVASNPESSKIIGVYESIGMLQLYDSNLKLIKKIAINESIQNQLENINNIIQNDDLPIAFNDIYVNDEYIYALFLNGTQKEITAEDKSYILVFDWDLNLQKSFKLDRAVSKFIVNSDAILGIDPFDEEKMLVKFDLN